MSVILRDVELGFIDIEKDEDKTRERNRNKESTRRVREAKNLKRDREPIPRKLQVKGGN